MTSRNKETKKLRYINLEKICSCDEKYISMQWTFRRWMF